MDDQDVEDVQLAERLQAYARARLSPSPSATARMRAHVMAEVQRRARLAQGDADPALPVVAGSPARLRILQGQRWRRPVAALVAASLTLALAVGSVAAAQPGGPLYGTRIWAETLTLPSNASDRATAEVRRMNARLAEIDAAVASGDLNAAKAAIDAYDSIVAEATAGTHGDPAANATLDAAVRRNVEVLTALLGKVPAAAQDAIEHAIEQSDTATNGLHGQPTSNPGNGPASTGKPEHTANPNKPTPKPQPTPKSNQGPAQPHPTPKPKPTPEAPAATAAPEHTPRASGRPSTDQGGGNLGG